MQRDCTVDNQCSLCHERTLLVKPDAASNLYKDVVHRVTTERALGCLVGRIIQFGHDRVGEARRLAKYSVAIWSAATSIGVNEVVPR
jgi:hypothetical protein